MILREHIIDKQGVLYNESYDTFHDVHDQIKPWRC